GRFLAARTLPQIRLTSAHQPLRQPWKCAICARKDGTSLKNVRCVFFALVLSADVAFYKRGFDHASRDVIQKQGCTHETISSSNGFNSRTRERCCRRR